MKRILIYLNTIALGLLLFTSCDPNTYPKFNDNDAFVAFNQTTAEVKENGESIKIPVTLASVSGISTTIVYESVDDSAKEGIDFTLADGSASLTFDAEHRTQYIVINILNRPGIYTGDLKFSLKFTNTGSIAQGQANVCVVTINDLDHPLAAILGDYTATGDNYWNGPVSWTMTLRKDEKDVSKVWFFNLFGLDSWAADDTMFYGIVSKDMKTISIPLGQTSVYKYSNGNPITLLGIDEEGNGHDEGNITVSIQDGGKKLDFGTEYGPWVWIEGAGNLNIINPGVTASKK